MFEILTEFVAGLFRSDRNLREGCVSGEADPVRRENWRRLVLWIFVAMALLTAGWQIYQTATGR